ncbi:MAG: hypothetical protein ABI543_08070 [Ignavibacteria bacterium]
MKKSDDLFQLIKAMSKSEKRYFKLHAGVHTIGEKNVYMKLFGEIDKMKIYDEKILRDKFKGEKFTKNLFSSKKYLLDLILKILSSYYQESSIDFKLTSMLDKMEILYSKGLYKLYKNLLVKAEKIATDNEKYHSIANILEKKAVIIITEFYGKKVDEDMDKLRIEMSEALDKIKYTYEYKMLYNKLFFLLKNNETKISRGDDSSLKQFISNPLFNDESKTATPAAKYFYYAILGHYYYNLGDYENSYKYRKALLDFMESYPRYTELYPKSYLSNAANLGAECEKVQRYEDIDICINKIKSFLNKRYANHKDYKDTWAKLIAALCELKLTYYIRTCRFDEFEDVKKILDDLDKYSDQYNEPRKIVVYNAVSCYYFINKDYSSALGYLNKTLNYMNTRPEESGYSAARIMNLIIHFEMGNYDLLEYTIKSTKNYLLKKNTFYTFEKLLINFFIDAANTNDAKKLSGKLEILRDELEKDGKCKSLLGAFDIISWIESKINKKDFKMVLKEKRKLQLESGKGN